MVNKLLSHIRVIKHPSLEDLDAIYRDAILYLPEFEQKKYCTRLISSTEYEAKQTKCRKKLQELKQLTSAAKQEVAKLQN